MPQYMREQNIAELEKIEKYYYSNSAYVVYIYNKYGTYYIFKETHEFDFGQQEI